jgi:hypothetical protein
VEQVAGVSIEGQSQSLNNVLVRDQVIARTSGYVKKHEIVSKKSEKGVLTVKVKADVGKSEISKDVEAARALVKRFGRPSIVIVIQEQSLLVQSDGKMGGSTSTEAAATVLTKAFKDDGWEIIDPNFITKDPKLNAAVSMGAVEAKHIGDISKARFILYGTVALRNQDPGSMGMQGGKQVYFPVSGEYNTTLFATDTGTQIAKLGGKLDQFEKGEKPVNDAKWSYERTAHDLIAARVAKVVAPVRQAALEYFRTNEVNGAEIKLAASGLGNYAGATEFKRALEALAGVKEVEQQEFKAGVGNYRVTYQGSPGEFAEAVGKATFKKKKLEVNAVAGNKVELAVLK